MRWFHIAVVGLFALATIIFAAQNLEIVNVTFLGFNARVPLALLIALIYVLGMATGGSLWAILRRSIQGARRPPPR
jgi:lipopolysaccharide assembly protein A